MATPTTTPTPTRRHPPWLECIRVVFTPLILADTLFSCFLGLLPLVKPSQTFVPTEMHGILSSTLSTHVLFNAFLVSAAYEKMQRKCLICTIFIVIFNGFHVLLIGIVSIVHLVNQAAGFFSWAFYLLYLTIAGAGELFAFSFFLVLALAPELPQQDAENGDNQASQGSGTSTE